MTAATTSRLRIRDALAVAFTSLRTRRLRTVLTASGVAVGIAAMVAVLGVSTSSRADLVATLDELGTNMLTVQPGQSFTGVRTALPDSAPGAIRRVDDVGQAAATASFDATVRRTERVPAAQTGGIRVAATEPSLLDTLQTGLAAGRFFDAAPHEYPTVVLGAIAAERLGINSIDDQPLVWLGDTWFVVVGILEPVVLAPEIDSTALVGFPAAAQVLHADPADITPTSVYVRTQPDRLDDVRQLLPRTANPQTPEAVRVSRPSDALAARAAVDTTFTALLLGLGGVALLVGGIGIANVMVISVLERRKEIGLRRSLGATRRHILIQFLLEAIALAGVGGLIGTAIGVGITVGYAASRGWSFALPPEGLVAATVLAVLVGALAGFYPAARAARLQPAEAVRPR
ncbi:ABC transporter permease [Phytoactinopolyspora mesophila]|uniref:FtsX-like permease family protein n=1 Tax=Phytoactinopolyspora mesophila TaxID=2650750 RepID=A0A7K3MB56_9ACTN|nr:ABC transporter permease [Phytoactinopolyspora mesophila]NDL60555.1 FtsX-like permease family protein [Phytoactinopolyspora mesophila]